MDQPPVTVENPATVENPVSPDDVERAAELITPHVRRTPVVDHAGVTLKLELLQHAGSFKPRGAFQRVLRERRLPDAGLITASGGNHGAAISFVANRLGIRAEVFMPATSPAIKKSVIERHGARVTVVEGFYDDAQAAADARQAQTGALMVHPFDHPATVAGQGTMGRELDGQLDGFDTLLVATGGGGLIAGQAAWFGRRVRIVSVEPEASQCLRAALEAGRPVDVPVGGVAADSLGARRLGAVPWSVVRNLVDDAVLVSDDDIREAQQQLWHDLRLVVEPGEPPPTQRFAPAPTGPSPASGWWSSCAAATATPPRYRGSRSRCRWCQPHDLIDRGFLPQRMGEEPSIERITWG